MSSNDTPTTTADPAAAYAWPWPRLPQFVMDELDKPLDEKRIAQRDARGSSRKLSYLETHDVIRRANEIFGFGQWGHDIVEIVEVAAVEVAHRTDATKRGWHVGYRCTVRLTVNGCVPVCGSGYGDGVEYGAAARVTACELATKEAESDAIKRAFKNFGDQFGLILYAKGDISDRLSRDQNADEATHASSTPMSVTACLSRIEQYTSDAPVWLKEVYRAHFQEDIPARFADVDPARKLEVLRRLQNVVAYLEQVMPQIDVDAAKLQPVVRAAFAAGFDGAAVSGPDPFPLPVPFA